MAAARRRSYRLKNFHSKAKHFGHNNRLSLGEEAHGKLGGFRLHASDINRPKVDVIVHDISLNEAPPVAFIAIGDAITLGREATPRIER